MNTHIYEENGRQAAIIQSKEVLITDGQSALDLMMNLQYQTGCRRIALNKEALASEFFILSSGLAGEVLQKFVNYRCKLAIYGDFSTYTSKPLHDFIYECNQGRDIFFAATEQEAAARLIGAE